PVSKPTPDTPRPALRTREGSRGTTLSPARPAHTPRHRLFGQATPGPGHHPTTAAGTPAPGPARARGEAGHSPAAATLPSATPRVQVERPQRSEDERPGGAARRRPHSAARKARGQPPLLTPQRQKRTSRAPKKTDRTP